MNANSRLDARMLSLILFTKICVFAYPNLYMCQILNEAFYLRMVQEEDGDTLDPLTMSYGGGGSLEVDGRFCISISIVSSLF